jgi:hypothetical protein
MIYLIEPSTFLNQKCRSRGICGRLTILPVCPPNYNCPLK